MVNKELKQHSVKEEMLAHRVKLAVTSGLKGGKNRNSIRTERFPSEGPGSEMKTKSYLEE